MSDPKFIKTEVDYNGWNSLGSSRLLSVSYSMVAAELEGPLKKLSVEGVTSDMEEPLFEVRNKNGQIVIAVYSEGVRIYVDDGDKKGLKGGFAIGALSGNEKTNVTSFTAITPKNYFIGHEAGGSITTGLYNSFLGYQAGRSNTDGACNIFIGYQAGRDETGSGLLYIDISPTPTSLVYGNFKTNEFRVNGDIEYTDTIGSPSDVSLK